MQEHDIDALMKMSAIVEPGTEMFGLLHTSDEGMIPPPADAPEGTEGTGSGHVFGPFVTREEAIEWNEMIGKVKGECDCRVAIIPILVPRLLGVIGPAGVPLDKAQADAILGPNWRSPKDGLN